MSEGTINRKTAMDTCDCCGKSYSPYWQQSRNPRCCPFCYRFREYAYVREAGQTRCHGECPECGLHKKLGPDNVCWRCVGVRRPEARAAARGAIMLPPGYRPAR